MNIIKTAILGSIIVCTVSCSSTESVNKLDSKTSSIYPEWYQQSGFETDSLFYSSFATAISSDSTLSIKRAEEQARANLEDYISKKMEAVRMELEEDGFDYAKNADFILTLRNAHAPIQTEAELTESSASKKGNSYRGFAKVSIRADKLKSMIKAGFEGKATYWTNIENADAFANL